MKIQSIIVALLLTVGLGFQAQAGDAMTADQIKALTVGKTVHAELLKNGMKFKVYFGEDGSAERTWKGDIQKGSYSFKGNMHCINVGDGDKCGTIVDNGDGTYKRMKNGKKHAITWLKFTDGKDL